MLDFENFCLTIRRSIWFLMKYESVNLWKVLHDILLLETEDSNSKIDGYSFDVVLEAQLKRRKVGLTFVLLVPLR